MSSLPIFNSSVPLSSPQIYSISQQNKHLHSEIINITLTHEQILQQNKRLSQQLQKKQLQLIQSSIKQSNLKHNLHQITSIYSNLQKQHKFLYDYMHSQKKFNFFQSSKRQSFFMNDLKMIQIQSYRQNQQKQDQQINKIRKQMIKLLKENQILKLNVLDSTMKYNEEIYQLKIEKVKLESKVSVYESNKNRFVNANNNNNQDQHSQSQSLMIFNLQVKLQNLSQNLKIQHQINQSLKKYNQQLYKKYKKIQTQLQSLNNSSYKSQQQDFQNKLKQQPSIKQYINLLQQNDKLRKQIQSISQKYIELTQRFPELIQNQQRILQLIEQSKKVQKIHSLTYKIQQLQKQKQILSSKIIQLQNLHKKVLLQKQQSDIRLSILTKRFNQIFIRMNPYFDIYQYSDINLDEKIYKFFDKNKDYKLLKQYQKEIYILKRENQEIQYNMNSKIKQLGGEIVKKDQKIKINENQNKKLKEQLDRLSNVNKGLMAQLRNKENKYNKVNQNNNDQIQMNMNEQNQQQQNQINNPTNNQQQNINEFMNQISIPILKNHIIYLQKQRQTLLIALQNSNKTISDLKYQLQQSKLHKQIQIIKIIQQKFIQTPLSSSTIENLLSSPHSVNNSQSLHSRINQLQSSLLNQSNLFQLQVKQYEQEYKNQLKKLSQILEEWKKLYHQLKNRVQVEEVSKSIDNVMDIENNYENVQEMNKKNSIMNTNQNRFNNNNDQNQLNININANQSFLNIPSHANLPNLDTKIASSNHQSSHNNNKLVGQLTIQTLTSTLKKYQSQMYEVLTMCNKITQSYNELKKKVADYQILQKKHKQLQQHSHTQQQQIQFIKTQLEQRNQSLLSTQNNYNLIYKQNQQYKHKLQTDRQIYNIQLIQQKKKNQKLTQQLDQLRQKTLQLVTKVKNQNKNNQDMNMNKNQFQTIVVMHQNKNRQVQLLNQKNKSLQGKVEKLMSQLREIKVKSNQNVLNTEFSPMEKAQIRQLSELLKNNDIKELIKNAKSLVEERERVNKQSLNQAAVVVQGQQEEQKQNKNNSSGDISY